VTPLAPLLAAARQAGRQVPALPPELIPPDVESGYAVADAVAGLLGWETLGWKIAGTTAAMREKLGVTEPIYGRSYHRFAMPSPARLAHHALLDPLVECEFFVTLAEDLPCDASPLTPDRIRAAVGQVQAGIEVAECRFPMAALPPLPAILADGSASGRYVFGDPIPQWREGLADIAVVLEVDGVARRQGRGADVMGDPLAPILWLAEARRRRGEGLRAGQVISTGSCTGMLPIRAGQRVRARFGHDALVEIAFDE
jgi:2-keto-4-pentenoate hydratase